MADVWRHPFAIFKRTTFVVIVSIGGVGLGGFLLIFSFIIVVLFGNC